MSEEEKKAVEYFKNLDISFNTLLRIELKGFESAINTILNLVEKQEKEIGLLRELLYMIRQETRYNTISFEDNYYRPIKNVTKQQIYESYNIIRTLVKGNYVMMNNKEAIDSIVGKE